MTPKQRKEARGEYWDDMLKVLKEMGDITPEERRFLKIVHGYRNELYHSGLSRDDIVRAIAGHYFLLCCDLFVRLGNMGLFLHTISSGEIYTEVAKRYLPMSEGRLDYPNIHNEVLAEKLRDALPVGMPNLAETLAGSARKSVGAIVENLEFSVQNNPSGFDSERMLEVAQFQRELNEEFERLASDGQGVNPNHLKSYFQSGKRVESHLEAEVFVTPQPEMDDSGYRR